MSARPTVEIIGQEHNGQVLLRRIQARHPNYHPAVALADLAHETDDEEIEFKCHAKLLEFVEPQLKAVQLEVNQPDSKTIKVSLFDTIDAEVVEVIEENTPPKLPQSLTVGALLGDVLT